MPVYKQRAKVSAILDYIYYLNLVEGFTSYLLKQLEIIRWFFTGIHTEVVSRRLYEFFWHFVGPKEVKMSNRDERDVISAVELLGGLGEQCAIFQMKVSVTKQTLDALYDFYQIGSSYKRAAILREIRKQIQAIEKEWHENTRREGKSVPRAILRLLVQARKRMGKS